MEAVTADRFGSQPRTDQEALGRDIPTTDDESSEAFIRPFEVRSELIGGCVRRIAICGELDHATAPRLEAALRPDFDEGLVVCDLSECGFIDLTGLALIIGAWRRLAGDGRQFALCGPSGQVERIMNITGAEDSIAVFRTLEEALAGNPWKQGEIPTDGSSLTSPIPLFRRPQLIEIFDRGCGSRAATP